MNCYYFASADEFLSIGNDQWLAKMLRGYHSLCEEAPSPEQIGAWKDCRLKLIPLLEQCNGFDCSLIFEYELPREGGRRPDVLLFSGDVLFVLEFKRKNHAKKADADQAEAYARDIRYYHSESRGLEVIPVLVPTRTSSKTALFGNVYVCSPDSLFALLQPKLSKEQTIDLCDWLQAEYHPLPSLVNAAKLLYHNEPLPTIRKAHSAGIPEAVEALRTVTKDAQANHKRVLALVTGVLGAGKTLLGLDFVYQSEGAVFLSGNRSLVAVLQYALDNKSFVAPLRNYVRDYGIREKGIPKEHILVFDEAQRAWDRTQVYKAYGVDRSEPELIISVADRLPQWSVQLGLIGDGQEIHKDEEAGMIQWAEAIQKSQNSWQVVCPSKLAPFFQGICEVISLDALNLTISLRSHLAGDVAKSMSST